MSRVAGALLGAALVVAGCSAPAPQEPTPGATFTKNGVIVTLSMVDWTSAGGTVKATFRPERAGFHLYSMKLPADGIEGIGRPTSVRAEGALAANGPLSTDAPLKDLALPGIDVKIPVYPDGPVTTTLPVRANAQGAAKLLFSYAACSVTEGCLMPVTDHPVSVTVSETEAVIGS